MTLVLPAMGTVVAIWWAVVHGLHVETLIVFLAMYVLTTTGLSVGFHRLFTHRAFNPGYFAKAFLAISGLMAGQGTLVFWVASHRRHHAYSDTEIDCHSPCLHDATRLGRLKGIWHAHVGWMLGEDMTNVLQFAKDICRDPLLVRLNRYYFLWVSLGLAIPAVIGFAAVGDWSGALEGFLWGGMLRLFAVHHVTWSVNSLCHVIGRRRHRSDDNSHNLGWLALLTMGEGWHNNHHACPAAANFGHRWWELDMGYAVIRLMRLCGLCSDVKCSRDPEYAMR